MKYLHTMLRISNVESSLEFYCDHLGLKEIRRIDNKEGRFTLIFLSAPDDKSAQVELTYNWNGDNLDSSSRNFGHLAYNVIDIYAICSRLKGAGVVINRPPRDGYMAFVKSPDNISIELLQIGKPLDPEEPWVSMENTGEW